MGKKDKPNSLPFSNLNTVPLAVTEKLMECTHSPACPEFALYPQKSFYRSLHSPLWSIKSSVKLYAAMNVQRRQTKARLLLLPLFLAGSWQACGHCFLQSCDSDNSAGLCSSLSTEYDHTKLGLDISHWVYIDIERGTRTLTWNASFDKN